jgi:hypothetical protein
MLQTYTKISEELYKLHMEWQIYKHHMTGKSWDSAVDIVTGYRLDDQGVRVPVTA